MGFDRTSSVDLVSGELYTSQQLRDLFASLNVKVDPEWEDDDCEEGQVPRLIIWNTFALPDGRYVFSHSHFTGDYHLVGSIVGEVGGLDRLSYNDHLYVYNACCPSDRWTRPHLTVKEVMEMPPICKQRFSHADRKNNMFMEEEDVVVIEETLRYKSQTKYFRVYEKLGFKAIAFLKSSVEKLDHGLYLVANGDCTCCS